MSEEKKEEQTKEKQEIKIKGNPMSTNIPPMVMVEASIVQDAVTYILKNPSGNMSVEVANRIINGLNKAQAINPKQSK